MHQPPCYLPCCRATARSEHTQPLAAGLLRQVCCPRQTDHVTSRATTSSSANPVAETQAACRHAIHRSAAVSAARACGGLTWYASHMGAGTGSIGTRLKRNPSAWWGSYKQGARAAARLLQAVRPARAESVCQLMRTLTCKNDVGWHGAMETAPAAAVAAVAATAHACRLPAISA